LRFLLGDWTAVKHCTWRERRGSTFSLGVQDRIMTRTNVATSPRAMAGQRSRHDDFMIIYAEGGHAQGRLLDSEQHVIRYASKRASDHEVVFASAAKPSGPRYRLSYTARSDDTLAGQFDVAPPANQMGSSPILSWTARKRR